MTTMRDDLLERLDALRQREEGFAPNPDGRWGGKTKKGWTRPEFVVDGKHISEIDFSSLDDKTLLDLFARILKRSVTLR